MNVINIVLSARIDLTKRKRERERQNTYRGGTSDATTSSSHIVPLFMISVDDFSPLKTAIFVGRK